MARTEIGRARIAALLLGVGMLLAGAAQAGSSVSIAATVNDEVISSTDVNERRALIMETSNIPVTEENIKRITPRILQSLIDETLQMQEAKRQSITIAPQEISKALDDMAAAQHLPPGTVQKHLAEKKLSLRSLENQVRSQLAWGKVVQRKLRRNVTISEDEVVRAQQAEAAAPGIGEMRLMALVVPITAPDKEAAVKALVQEIGTALKAGKSLPELATKYRGRKDVQFNPAVWVTTESMPAEVATALQDIKAGQTAGPLRLGNSVQFITVIEQRVTKKPALSTEVMIKQITVDLPTRPDKEGIAKLAASEQALRANPGNCEDTTLPTTPLVASASFARAKMGALSPEQRLILARLEVGQLSEPLMAPDKLRLVLLCERSEATGSEADAENVRQKLFAEKMELEAQKHLRNLRRDASIDIRGDN